MKNKLLVRIIFFVLFISALAFLYFNQNGFAKYLKTKNELNKIEEQIKKSETELFRLRQEIDSLKNSREKIEKVAREKFNMTKPNERVFKIEEK